MLNFLQNTTYMYIPSTRFLYAIKAYYQETSCVCIVEFPVLLFCLCTSAGLIPRCAAELFKLIDSHLDSNLQWKYNVFFSYLEIYQEKVTSTIYYIIISEFDVVTAGVANPTKFFSLATNF